MKKNLKLESGLLNRLTNLTNRSNSQTQFLFELCDFNFHKLLELERKLKNNFVFYCPGDKESVSKILAMSEGSKWFKLTLTMCRPAVRFKELPELTGFANNELTENRCRHCWHSKFKAQWGVFWNQKELSEWITNKKGGIPNYWQDKDSLEMLLVEDGPIDRPNKLWGYDPVFELEKEKAEDEAKREMEDKIRKSEIKKITKKLKNEKSK